MQIHTLCVSLLLGIPLVFPALVRAEGTKVVSLPKPQMEGGKPLMEALKERQSSRAFSSRKLPIQVLSNMLWAAYGINRPVSGTSNVLSERQDAGKRTAPSARNWQEIDIYVAMQDGLYLYGPKEHTLNLVFSKDIRAMTGRQPFVQDAPVNLVYVADFSRMTDASMEDKVFYSAADTGFVGQNVYLYCASEGLAAVVRGSIDRPALEKAMRLRPDQHVILAQSVGYPKE